MPFPGAGTYPGLVVFPGVGGGGGPGADVTVTARILGPWVFEPESVDFTELGVWVNGSPAAAFEMSVVPDPLRPGTWVAPDELGGVPGIMVDSWASGLYEVFVRVTEPPEAPVISAGVVHIRGGV